MLTSLLAISPSPWFQPFVWLDYRVAVLFTIIILNYIYKLRLFKDK